MNAIFSEDLAKMNIDNAIKADAIGQLSDILPRLTRDKLLVLASGQNVTGRSKMKKQELVEALCEGLPSTSYLQDILLLAKPEELSLFETILQVPYANDLDFVPGQYLYLMSAGVLFSFYDGSRLTYLVPAEVKESYRRIPMEDFRKTRERYWMVHSYMEAAVELYGVCPLEKLVEIFNTQNPIPLQLEELWSKIEFFFRRDQIFFVDQDDLVSHYFDYDNRDELDGLRMMTQVKPYYVPERQEFLRYADTFYYEMTPQLIQLKQYIEKNLTSNQETVEALIDEIHLDCSMEQPLGSIVNLFDHWGVPLRNKRQVSEILPLIVDVQNQTRLWSNRGHTPRELSGEGASGGYAGKSNVVSLTQGGTGSLKVGRNEPCPCGSGKKYKKCCGG